MSGQYGTSDAMTNLAVVDVSASKTPRGQAAAKALYTVQGGFTYVLAAAAAITSGGATTAIGGVAGGSYLLAVTAANFNSATIKLQFLGPDGTTWLDVAGASLTANGSVGVVVGEGASLRLAATGGAPATVNASLT